MKNQSSHEAESIAYLLKSITDGRKTIYIAVPMTTGHNFLHWYANEGAAIDSSTEEYRKKHHEKVILPNCEAAKKRIAAIRCNYSNAIIIDPTSFSISEWTQEEYHYFWGKIIECCVNKVVLLDGWQYSVGCSYEFLTAVQNGIETLTENGSPLSRGLGVNLILSAITELKQNALPTVYLERVIRELGLPINEGIKTASFGDYKSYLITSTVAESQAHYKDAVLDYLANDRNIAQFVSFAPENKLKLRFARIIGVTPNKKFSSVRKAIETLLGKAEDGLVNIRTFRPDQPKGGEFFYGKNNLDEIISILSAQATKGLFTIVNETIDINDGGVSGVALGDIIEFAPYDTPKCVDKSGICSMPRKMAIHVLENVYGFRPTLNFDERIRVEFSIHPKKRGFHKEHTIIWETEEIGTITTTAHNIWPNIFSQMIGDKVFGLLIAEAIGLPVPQGTVISRSVAPFTFGHATEKWDTWMRTCPKTRTPGKYPTISGWQDPFEFMDLNNHEAPSSKNFKNVSALLVQDSVYPEYSGSLISGKKGNPLIEGVHGRGDGFMIGQAKPEKLPPEVIYAVKKQHKKAYDILGPIEMEWVYDGLTVWIVQLHRQKDEVILKGNIIYPGKLTSFHTFHTAQGLESLRKLIAKVQGSSKGILLMGDVGITSHFGDLLRNAKIPSRIERS